MHKECGDAAAIGAGNCKSFARRSVTGGWFLGRPGGVGARVLGSRRGGCCLGSFVIGSGPEKGRQVRRRGVGCAFHLFSPTPADSWPSRRPLRCDTSWSHRHVPAHCTAQPAPPHPAICPASPMSASPSVRCRRAAATPCARRRDTSWPGAALLRRCDATDWPPKAHPCRGPCALHRKLF